MIGLEGVIGVLLGDVACARQQLVEHPRGGGCSVGGRFAGVWTVIEGAGEKPAGGGQIPFLGDQHVNDLAELVDRTVQRDPPSGDLDRGFLDESAITRRVPTGSCCIDEQRGEPLHLPVEGHVINHGAAFDQQLLDVARGQGVAQVLPHRDHDHVRREAEAREPGLR